MKIVAEKPTIDINAALDLIGKDFRFNHAKGIAEWIKNSVDAYNLSDVPDSDQNIIISFVVSSNDYVQEIDVLDFVGMSKEKIDQGFKVWFSPEAAQITNESILSQKKTYGGHGNGGKFYMRQMFQESLATTYFYGRLSVFGFNKNKQYGYDEKYKDYIIEPEEAIRITGLDKRGLAKPWLDNILSKSNGFSLIQGIRPKKSPGTNYRIQLAEKIIQNPQARRLIMRKEVFIQTLPELRLTKLTVPRISPKAGFEEPIEYVCPPKIDLFGKQIKMTNKNYPDPPKLTLYTSEDPLKGASRFGINSIDFLGEIGIVASYQIHELGRFSSGFTDFVYGECICPIMEDEDEDCVRNDREKFINSDRTDALLSWVQDCIDELTSALELKHRKDKKQRDLKDTSSFNQILNTWKNRFVKALLKEQLFGDDIGRTGIGGDEDIGSIIGRSPGKKTGKRAEKKGGSKGGQETKKTPAQPNVLISSHDIDPLSEEEKPYDCDPRQPAVHQRPIDVSHGIYWINTSKPLASKILTLEGSDSPRWRSYLFQRYVDIIVKEAIFELGKRELDLTADDVNRKIDEIISRVSDQATEDLEGFLFDIDYKL